LPRFNFLLRFFLEPETADSQGRPIRNESFHAKGPHVIALRKALKRYAVEEDLIPGVLLAAFDEEIHLRKTEQQAKAAWTITKRTGSKQMCFDSRVC